MWRVYGCNNSSDEAATRFQTGWFLESLFTQVGGRVGGRAGGRAGAHRWVGQVAGGGESVQQRGAGVGGQQQVRLERPDRAIQRTTAKPPAYRAAPLTVVRPHPSAGQQPPPPRTHHFHVWDVGVVDVSRCCTQGASGGGGGGGVGMEGGRGGSGAHRRWV